jgi:hypothetical protein
MMRRTALFDDDRWIAGNRLELCAGSGQRRDAIADPKEMWKDLGAPLHPGAAKYFKEKGLMP